MRYKLTISYDGTPFAGWQVQKNGSSVQFLVQKALQTVLRQKFDLTGASRTDAGVHALGQVAHFDTDVEFASGKFLHSLNALLPEEIRVLEIVQVKPDFHARYSAKAKIYHYHLHLDPIADPFTKAYRYQIFGQFNKNLAQLASQQFIGTHDFTSFANVKENSPSAVRTLYRVDLVEQKGGVRVELEGDGFLYKMVRNVVGMIVDVARGKVAVDKIREIFEAKDRRRAGEALPARGLFLMEIKYNE